MEHAASLTDLNSDEAKVAEMRMGANWFFWIAILAVASSLIVYFYSFTNHLVGLGINHYFESQAAATGNDSGRLFALSMSFLFAAVLAGFGYYARKGGDVVFILGAFLYLADGVILLGYREFFAFAFRSRLKSAPLSRFLASLVGACISLSPSWPVTGFSRHLHYPKAAPCDSSDPES